MARRRQSSRSAGPSPGVAHGEYVVYPGTRPEVYDLIERLSAAAGDSPEFGTPGLSLDRTRLTVRWFGQGLAREHAPVVQAASARPEGDGIDLFIAPDAVQRAGSLAAAVLDAGVESGLPLFPDERSD